MSAATQNEMERLRKELEAAQAERDTLASRVDCLNQQNSALAAHVERLPAPWLARKMTEEDAGRIYDEYVKLTEECY